MDIEQFYDADPRRRASEELEFGREWSDADGARCELSWVEDTGELYAMREPRPGIISDPLGDEWLTRMDTSSLTVEVLGTVTGRDAIERVLAGWSAAMREPNNITWVCERLANPPAAPAGTPGAGDEEPFDLPGASS